MKTKPYKPTSKQEFAANAARNYLRQRGGVEEDAINEEKQCIEIGTSYRESAGDDEPSEQLRKEVAAHVKALRELSPLVYVSTEEIDEWIHLTARVKDKPRKDKPELMKDLAKVVLDRLPESVSKHPKSRFIGQEYSRNYCGTIAVLTEVTYTYGKRSVRLGWQLDGDTTNGWKLRVEWGDHRIVRPAKFKKLTPATVLDQFDKLLARLEDPLGAMGWTINVLINGDYIKNLSGRVRESFDLYTVTDKARTVVVSCRQGTHVEFTNNYSGKTIKVAVGEPLPAEVLPVNIEE
jgi:hypothetical protein